MLRSTLTIIFSVFLSTIQAEDEHSDVFVLTSDNSDQFLAENPLAVIKFYAPWCGHCKAFAPEYEKISTDFKETVNIPVAKVDCDDFKDFCTKYEVQGYPTIKIYRQEPESNMYEYKGARNGDAIKEKVLEMNEDSWEPPKSAVIDLTKENFNDVITSDFALVMFYAPWCGHCKSMKPAYEEAAQMLKDQPFEDLKQQPIIARLDATVEGEIASKYGVSGYPTLKIFRQGADSEYKGGRDANAILEEIQKNTGDPTKEFDSISDAKKVVLETVGDSVLIFCVDNSDSNMLEKMNNIANDFRVDWLDIFRVSDPGMQETIKCKAGEFFMVHDKNFRSKLENDRIVIGSADDVRANKIPLVGQAFKQSEAALYADGDKPLVKIFGHFDFTPKYRKASQIIRKKVLSVVSENKDLRNHFTFGLYNEDDFSDGLKQCYLQDTAEDINVCVTSSNGKKIWPLIDEEFDEDTLTDFLFSIKKGKLKPVVKSAKVPKKNNGPVKIVVGNNFEEIVMKKNQKVLIEFYAPWCGHCKQLEPTYKKLGKEYEKVKDITIAKMDTTANDIPVDGFDVTGFPTIYWVDENNEISKFDGGRDLKGFRKFIEGKNDQKDEL